MTTAPLASITSFPATSNHLTSSATAGEWIQMNPRDISSSVYNEKPLTEETHKLKIRNIQHAINSRNLEAAQTLAMSREGLLTKSFRKQLCKYILYENELNFQYIFRTDSNNHHHFIES